MPFERLPETLKAKLVDNGDAKAAGGATLHVSVPISAEVLRALKASGPGWQGRVDEMLREQLARGA